MSKAYTVLCFGDSPTCTFIAWRLAVGTCQIITVNSNATSPNEENIYWKSEKYNSDDYKPFANYNHHSQLNQCKENIDVILLSANSIYDLIDISCYLKPLIRDDTLILIDSCFANNADCLLIQTFPHNAILSIISEVIVKIIKYDTRNVFNQLGNKVTTRIGTTISNAPQHIVDTLAGSNKPGKKLTELTQLLQSNGVYPSTVFQYGVRPTVASFIWKHVLAFVSFSILSVVYGELSLKNSSQKIIIKKVFYDLLKLALLDCEHEFPNLNDKDKCEQLFYELLDQYNQLHSHYKVVTSKGERSYVSDELLDVPLCIYNFSNNFNTHIPLCLQQLLKTSKSLNLETPYIECVNSFYLEIEKVNEQKIFDWITKALYKPTQPLSLQKPKSVNQSIAYNNNSFSSLPLSGTETPPTPMSNKIPAGYSFYPEYNVLVPSGTNPMSFQSQQMVAAQYQQPGITIGMGCKGKKEYSQHPRFKNVPKEEVNGKKISYHQVKNLVYPTTKGSNVPQNLSLAHKHIYQYANLNHIFESVNNRYGTVDSLDIFKLSSGFKDEDEGDDREKYGDTIDNIGINEKEKVDGDKISDLRNDKEYNKDTEIGLQPEAPGSQNISGNSGSDIELTDAEQEINLVHI